MLPSGQAKGQIWRNDQFLCDADYEIDKPMEIIAKIPVQRIALAVAEEHCVVLMNGYGLTLVLADGQRCKIPRPIRLESQNRLVCFITW